MVSVLITGANRGIGFEFAREYAEDGDRVFACCRNPGQAASLKALAARHGGKVTLHALDVTDEKSVIELRDVLQSETIDILINNAGIAGDLRSTVLDYAEWEASFRTNTIAPFRMALAFKSHLTKSQSAKLVTISSGRASNARARGEDFAYCASKAAVNSVMKNLSVAWAKDTIIVALFGPGAVRTDMNPNGALSPQESVSGMRKKIAGLEQADTGGYFDWQGRVVPW
jgi:NAD(P)-dependent dehydrogenase (short-subunit alcohol dehydrogenase family)